MAWLKNRARKISGQEPEPVLTKSVSEGTSSNSISKENLVGAMEPHLDDALISSIPHRGLDARLQRPQRPKGKVDIMDFAAMSLFGGGGTVPEDMFFTACELQARIDDARNIYNSKLVDINWRYKDGSTSLLIATSRGNTDIAAFLIDLRGIDLDCTWNGNGGDTPLTLAIHKGHLKIAWMLIRAKASVTRSSCLGHTPLHRAASRGDQDLVEALIAARANTNATTMGATPMVLAAESGHVAIVRCLCKFRARLDASGIDGMSAITASAQNGHLQILQDLLEWGVRDEDDGADMTALFRATANDHMDAAIALIKLGADPLSVDSTHQLSPFEVCAGQNGEDALVRMMTEYAASNPEASADLMQRMKQGSNALRHDRTTGKIGVEIAQSYLNCGRCSAAIRALADVQEGVTKYILLSKSYAAKMNIQEAIQFAERAVALEPSTTAIHCLLDALLASHGVADAHVRAATWAQTQPGDIGWQMQQSILRRSPFVWYHHPGLEVFASDKGFGMRTNQRIPEGAAVIAEISAVPWSSKETRDPNWIQKYLRNQVADKHELAIGNEVPYSDILEGLYPRNDEADALLHHLNNIPEQVLGMLGDCDAQRVKVLARVMVNSHDDGVHLSEAFINHSCEPNCELQSLYHAQMFATKDIEVGEEITITYMQMRNLLQAGMTRKDVFSRHWGVDCACLRCQSEETSGCNYKNDKTFSSTVEAFLTSIKMQPTAADLRQLWNGDVAPVDCEWKIAVISDVLVDILAVCQQREIHWSASELVFHFKIIYEHCNRLSERFGMSALLEKPHKLLAHFGSELQASGEIPANLENSIYKIIARSKRRYYRAIVTNDHEHAHEIPDRHLVGDSIVIQGLQKRADLNGATGEILSYDREKDRYGVSIFQSANRTDKVSVRRENLVPSPKAR